MQSTIHLRANRAFIFALVTAHGMLVLLPFLLPMSYLWAGLLTPLVLLSSLQWGLIHEGIHKLLLPDATQNERASRVLAVLMGASFHVLRFGHLMHHKMNRDWHSERVPAKTLLARSYYYANLFVGLYLGEMLTSILLTVLPRRTFMRVARASFLKGYEPVAIAGERFFYQRGNIRAVRTDTVVMLGFYATAFVLYGVYWPVLAVFLMTRAMVVSFMDNVYHYATPADNSKPGKELALPEWASLGLLRSNYHETHHLNPEVPWHQLPQVHAAQGRMFDGPWLAHARMQLAGPVV